jgi:hypothetical protein
MELGISRLLGLKTEQQGDQCNYWKLRTSPSGITRVWMKNAAKACSSRQISALKPNRSSYQVDGCFSWRGHLGFTLAQGSCCRTNTQPLYAFFTNSAQCELWFHRWWLIIQSLPQRSRCTGRSSETRVWVAIRNESLKVRLHLIIRSVLILPVNHYPGREALRVWPDSATCGPFHRPEKPVWFIFTDTRSRIR